MQWKKTINHLGTQHVSKKRACDILAITLGVPASTIATYTTPSNYGSHYKANLHSGHYGSHNSKGYDREYKRLIRRLYELLPQFFNGNSELSLTELTGRIESNGGISMRESTLEKLLGKYEGNAPLVKTESGNYQLNQSFYQAK